MTTTTFNELLALIGEGNIKQIYTGLENGCRCGCHGRYFEPSERGFKMAMTKAKKLNPMISIGGFNEVNDFFHQMDKNPPDNPFGFAEPTPNKFEWIDIVVNPTDESWKTITLYMTVD